MLITITDNSGAELHAYKLSPSVIATLDSLRLAKKNPVGEPIDPSVAAFLETITFDVYNSIVAQRPDLLPPDEKSFLDDLQAQAKAWQESKIMVARDAARVEKPVKGK